jgi:hypothetical protein
MQNAKKITQIGIFWFENIAAGNPGLSSARTFVCFDLTYVTVSGFIFHVTFLNRVFSPICFFGCLCSNLCPPAPSYRHILPLGMEKLELRRNLFLEPGD